LDHAFDLGDIKGRPMASLNLMIVITAPADPNRNFTPTVRHDISCSSMGGAGFPSQL
jgi:hypothetical protein